MVVSSFWTVETICPLMVSARAWLFASAVRHHRMWTPTALTMIDARTRPEIARRIPIRMIDGASHSIFRKKRHRCRANGFASGHAYLSEHWPITNHGALWTICSDVPIGGTSTTCGYPRVRRLTEPFRMAFLMRHKVIE